MTGFILRKLGNMRVQDIRSLSRLDVDWRIWEWFLKGAGIGVVFCSVLLLTRPTYYVKSTSTAPYTEQYNLLLKRVRL